jgi:hypothetical protein
MRHTGGGRDRCDRDVACCDKRLWAWHPTTKGRPMTHSSLRLLSAAAATALLFAARPALAYDDMPWPVADDLGFTLYGQINQSYLTYDDGFDQRGFFTVDNSTNYDGSFVGIRGGKLLDSGAVLAGRFEFDIQPRPSDVTSLQAPAGGGLVIDSEDIRSAELAYLTTGAGTVYFGQGDMSANLWAPDYSGTMVIAGPNMSLIAGGMVLRYPDGALSGRTLSEAIGTFDSGQRFRLRYDSVTLSGFTVSASVGREVLTEGDDSTYLDLSGKYERETVNWVYSAALSVTGIGDDEYAGIASFAYLHKPSGINVTFTGTHSTTDQHYFFFKGGIVRQIFPIGATALSVDWYNNGNWAAEHAENETFGVSLVQDIDAANLQLYATIRSFDDYTNASDLPEENFEKGKAIAAGLKWTF